MLSIYMFLFLVELVQHLSLDILSQFLFLILLELKLLDPVICERYSFMLQDLRKTIAAATSQ